MEKKLWELDPQLSDSNHQETSEYYSLNGTATDPFHHLPPTTFPLSLSLHLSLCLASVVQHLRKSSLKSYTIADGLYQNIIIDLHMLKHGIIPSAICNAARDESRLHHPRKYLPPCYKHAAWQGPTSKLLISKREWISPKVAHKNEESCFSPGSWEEATRALNTRLMCRVCDTQLQSRPTQHEWRRWLFISNVHLVICNC